MYYSAIRPAEAANLPESALSLPKSGWGEIFLPGSASTTGAAWSDNGRRVVPSPPPLTELLRAHLREFGTDERGRLFRASRPGGGDLSDSVYGRVWAAVLTPAEAASPLARRPYDLQHAAGSTWLNGGVPAPQVAAWAGHSVDVLLRVYAKCIVGQEEAARLRIRHALGLLE
jgi:integrase